MTEGTDRFDAELYCLIRRVGFLITRPMKKALDIKF